MRQSQLIGLQAGRGVAALMVVTYHASLILAKYTGFLVGAGFLQAFGRAGVDFFFILSGFIIYLVHVEDIGQPRAFARYLRKRLTRVYLPYWAILVMVIPVFFLQPSFGGGYERNLDSIIKSFTLYPADETGGVLIIQPAWTLAHEVVFYVSFSLIILNAKIGRIALLSWLAAVICGQFITRPYPLDFFLYVKNIEFFIGIATAKLVLETSVKPSWWVAVLGLCIFLATAIAEFMTYSFYSSPFTLGYGAGAALIIFCLAARERQGASMALLKPLAALGDASYSLYLVHCLASVSS